MVRAGSGGVFTRAMIEQKSSWGQSTNYTAAFNLLLSHVEYNTVVWMITAPDDMESWKESLNAIHGILDTGWFVAYYLGNAQDMAPGTAQRRVMDSLCTAGIEPQRTDIVHFQQAVQNAFRHRLCPVYDGGVAYMGHLSVKFADPIADTVTLTGLSVVTDVTDAKQAACISAVLLAFLKEYGTKDGFPFLSVVRQLKNWMSRFASESLYGFREMMDALTLFACRQSLDRTNFDQFNVMFAAASLCASVTPARDMFSGDTKREWDDLFEKATICDGEQPSTFTRRTVDNESTHKTGW